MHIKPYDYTKDVRNFWEIHWKNNPRTGKVSRLRRDGSSCGSISGFRPARGTKSFLRSERTKSGRKGSSPNG